MADSVIKFVQQNGSADGSDLPSTQQGETGLLATEDGLVAFSQGNLWFLDKPNFTGSTTIGELTSAWQDLTGSITIPSNIGTENGCIFRLECDIRGVDTGGEYSVGCIELQVLNITAEAEYGTWTIPYLPDTTFRIPVVLKFYANPNDQVFVRARTFNAANVGDVYLIDPSFRRDHYID